jgi:hypothetical protein
MNRLFGLVILIFGAALFYYLYVQVAPTLKSGELFSIKSNIEKIRTETRNKLYPQSPPAKYTPQPSVSVSPNRIEIKEQPIPPAGFKIEDLSPYYRQVRIVSVTPPNFAGGQFAIRGETGLGAAVNITGWRVKDNKGHEVIIPQAVSNYTPFGVAEKQDILISSGHYVYFYGSQNSFVSGLRLNKCIGYLDVAGAINPPLPSSCPALYDRGEIISFSGKCQNFINSLRPCEVPDLNRYYSSVPADDSQCRAFIDRFNYRGCYLRFFNSPDFFLGEWRIWLGRALPFDPFHDRLLLFDNKGLVVDEFVY